MAVGGVGLARVGQDPNGSPQSRANWGRLGNPDLVTLSSNSIYIDSNGRLLLRLNGATLAQTADGLRVNPSGSPVVTGLTITGLAGFLFGTAGVVSAVNTVATSLNTQTTTTGNTAATETTIFTYTVPASTLATNGDALYFRINGKFANNGNADKRIRLYFGATTFYDSGNQTETDNLWSVEGYIYRTGAATQKCECGWSITSTTFEMAGYSTAAETLSGAIVLKITGIGTGASDVVGEAWKIVKVPA